MTIMFRIVFHVVTTGRDVAAPSKLANTNTGDNDGFLRCL